MPISCAEETMPVSGVRSSWLTLASSMDLALLSNWASALAVCRRRMSEDAYSGVMISTATWEISARPGCRQCGDNSITATNPTRETPWHRNMARLPSRKPKPSAVKTYRPANRMAGSPKM